MNNDIKKQIRINKWAEGRYKKSNPSPFYNWFCKFIEEKEIDMCIYLTEELQVGDVCQSIADTCNSEQAQIKNTLVKIDFHNGDVYHFFKFLANSGKVQKVGL